MRKILDYLNHTTVGNMTVARLIYVALVLIAFLIVMKIIMRITRKALKKSDQIDKGAQILIARGVKFLLIALFIITACGMLGVEISSFVALMSIVGAALALAAQNILTNLFDGIILLYFIKK